MTDVTEKRGGQPLLGPGLSEACTADLDGDGDGVVGVDDLVTLIANW